MTESSVKRFGIQWTPLTDTSSLEHDNYGLK